MKEPKWESLPDYGDLMTVEDFAEAVRSGCFIDYDGFGEYATATQTSRIRIYPSEFRRTKIVDKRFTHIIWFNK